ncbi:flavodoxin [Vibrio mediterranei]|uniref:flavodoxin n=1 Tax=Vibrio mediterranei TaxID=689 RepID=UPI0022844539|nr:flavodoxin [Vibrio mediterranei]MCY9855352.1 flavodoxin [Vibrio mediterranei]
MKDVAERLYSNKNQWLASQIDVDFPTPESVQGRELYQESLSSNYLESLKVDSESDLNIEWHKVDFHRLTVMFALLQAKRWAIEHHQNAIVEFFAQIILDQSYDLYLGFEGGEACAAVLVSKEDTVVLFSDLVTCHSAQDLSPEPIIASLIQTLDIAKESDLWIEKR